MRALLVLVVFLVAQGCVRAVREERRERPVDTGVPVSFSGEGPRRWEFGDGATASGQQVQHAFAKAGRYEVKAFEGERLTDRLSVLVQPRDVFRAVSPRADAVLVFRSVDDVAPAIDFLEKVASGATVASLVERAPLLQFLLEPGPGARAAIDPLEGAGAWLSRGGAALVTFVGSQDDETLARAFREFLLEHGFRAFDGAPSRFVRGEGVGELVLHWGTLSFVQAADEPALLEAVASIRAEPLGLEADAQMAAAISELASGGVAFLARAGAVTKGQGGRWRLVSGALKFGADDGRLVGRLHGEAPLWKTPPATRPERLLAHAPEGPVAALAMDVPVLEALDALGLAPRKADDEAEVRAGLGVLSRRLDLALYFDVDEFLAATLKRGGRPSPRFTLLGETAVPDRVAVQGAIERLLARRRIPFTTATEKELSLWRTTIEDQPAELAIARDTLFLRWGRALSGATPADLLARFEKRMEGAGGPGHLTLFVDVGELGRQLLEPRRVPGLDPRMVVTTQALTATFLTQITALDQLLFDLAPTPTGAAFHLEVKLTKRDPRE